MPRESEPKRYHSRFDREPSPKRSRRNGKPTMERSPNRISTEVRDKDDDRKHRRRLQDPLPLEKPHASDSKHDDRSNAAQDGESTGRRGTSERGWWRQHRDDQKDEKSIALADNDRVQNRDQPSKTNADRYQPTRKFREEKLPPAEPQPEEKPAAEPVKPAGGIHRHPERAERDRAYRARPDKAGGHYPPRDRYGGGGARYGGGGAGGGRFRGREGYTGRQGYQSGGGGGSGGGRVEKWKHDLFDEVNRSPAKNEEDPVAKVEALLAS